MRKPFQYGTFTNMSSKEHAVQYLQKGRTLRLPMHSENARKKSTTKTAAKNTRPVRNAPNKRVRHVKPKNNQEDSTEENVDAEAALYIKELHEDWANINLIRPTEFNPQKNDQINKNTNWEFWVETTTKAGKIQWLTDTGSPRSFINTQKALELSNKIDNAEIHPYNEETTYRCFNNSDIAIKGVLHMELKSGSWNAKNCKILVVDNKTNNIMGRDVLAKLGITLKAEKSHGKQGHTILNIQTEKNIIKWIFQKYPHLCTRLGRSKNHIAKSLFRQNYTPSQL